MLQQDLGAQQEQDHAAGDLGLLLELAAEDIADLHAQRGERAGHDADQEHRQEDLAALQHHGQADTDGQGIDGSRDRHEDQVASMIHAMNANTFTCGVFHLVDGVSAETFAATMNEFAEQITKLGPNRRLEDLRCRK